MTGGGARSTQLSPPGSLRRSVQLFRAFRVEQSDPDFFYGLLARDSVRLLEDWVSLRGATVLDVGGGPGYFAREFRRSGARYLAVDANLGELSAVSSPGPGTVVGSGMALPFRGASLDCCFSSNVLEHVPDPERMADEMVRVTRPGGVTWLSYTVWLSPWGGHETAPWHYLGGERAAVRYQRANGRPPKNRFGVSLFRLSAARMTRWARCRADVDVLAVFPRYHPRWASWLASEPGVRELAVWNLVIVLRKR